MSEDLREDFQAMKEAKKQRNKTAQLYASNELSNFCVANGLQLTTLHAWHFRVVGRFTVDLFPNNRKFHNVTANKRGKYRSMRGILEHIFEIKKPIENPKETQAFLIVKKD